MEIIMLKKKIIHKQVAQLRVKHVEPHIDQMLRL